MTTVFDPIVSAFETAQEEASYNAWLRAKAAASLADPRPSIPHDEAMARIRRTIAAAERTMQANEARAQMAA